MAREYNSFSILSNTSKMPCPSISLDAELCSTGSKLALISGSVCNKCYALKGHYKQGNVKHSMSKRLEFMQGEDFVPRMTAILGALRLFRWFDSGDIQSEKMGHDILDIIEATPWCQHWLPSKEYKWWHSILKTRKLPPNVALRLSTPMDDTRPLKGFDLTSTTYTHDSSPAIDGHMCPAHLNKEKYGKYECGECRACWDISVANIAYPKRGERASKPIHHSNKLEDAA